MRGSNGGVSIWPKCIKLARNSWARHSCTKLFVGGLSYDTNEPVLKDAFGKHGEIIEGNASSIEVVNNIIFLLVAIDLLEGITLSYVTVKVICDHVSGKSKGYGFVKFTSETEASTALKEMHGQLMDGRQIRLEFAHQG